MEEGGLLVGVGVNNNRVTVVGAEGRNKNDLRSVLTREGGGGLVLFVATQRYDAHKQRRNGEEGRDRSWDGIRYTPVFLVMRR